MSPTAANGTALALVSTALGGDEDDASKQQQQRTIHVFNADKGANGSFSLSLRKVSDDDDDDYVLDFDVWPKLALNDATPLIKLVNSANLLALMGTTQYYQV